MWIYTTEGFMSAVVDRDDPGMLYLRSREPIVFDEFFRGKELIQLEKSDYEWRIHVSKDEFLTFMEKHVDDLRYDNFKEAAFKSCPWLINTYSRVYNATLNLGDCHADGEQFLAPVKTEH